MIKHYNISDIAIDIKTKIAKITVAETVEGVIVNKPDLRNLYVVLDAINENNVASLNLLFNSLSWQDTLTDRDYYIDSEGALTLRPQAPSSVYVWNHVSNTWVDPRTLAELKDAKWQEIKEARNTQEFGGFIWDGSHFSSDITSQQRISSAVQLASISKNSGQPFTVTWTLSNNTTRTLNADEMILVGLTLGNHVEAGFIKGQLLQQQIAEAQTAAELAAISW